MKYQNLSSFESATPNPLCRSYLVIIPDDYERGRAIDKIRFFCGGDPVSFDGTESSLRQIQDALLSPSFFSVEPVVLIDEAEKMGKKELKSLADLVLQKQSYGYILCGARSKTILNDPFEKEGVVLDLGEEKSWDKEKRLSQTLVAKAAATFKRLPPDAASLLIERVGADAALLDSELQKLICYVGEKPSIERADILRICPISRTQTLWFAAEEIVWEKASPSLEAASFHALVPAIRSQLLLGKKLTFLIDANCPRAEWSAYLPKIWPKTLEKRASQAAGLGSAYFRKALDLLFEIELLSRSGQTHETALLDLFRSSLGR